MIFPGSGPKRDPRVSEPTGPGSRRRSGPSTGREASGTSCAPSAPSAPSKPSPKSIPVMSTFGKPPAGRSPTATDPGPSSTSTASTWSSPYATASSRSRAGVPMLRDRREESSVLARGEAAPELTSTFHELPGLPKDEEISDKLEHRDVLEEWFLSFKDGSTSKVPGLSVSSSPPFYASG